MDIQGAEVSFETCSFKNMGTEAIHFALMKIIDSNLSIIGCHFLSNYGTICSSESSNLSMSGNSVLYHLLSEDESLYSGADNSIMLAFENEYLHSVLSQV